MSNEHGPEVQETTRRALNERERRGLEVIRRHIRLTGRAPSCAQLAKAMGYKNRSAAQQLLQTMAHHGIIEVLHGVRHGIRVPGEHEPELPPGGPGRRSETPPPLSPRQAEVLSFIRRYQRRHGKAPLGKEIARALGLRGAKGSSVDTHLRALVRKQQIRLTGEHRGIRLVEPDERPVIEVGDTVAANEPLLAERRIVDRVAGTLCDRFEPRPDYFIRTSTAAMPALAVEPGDLIAVCEATDAESGTVVVARIGDTVQIGEVRTVDAHNVFMPLASGKAATANMKGKGFRIDGRVVGSLHGRALATRNALTKR